VVTPRTVNTDDKPVLELAPVGLAPFICAPVYRAEAANKSFAAMALE